MGSLKRAPIATAHGVQLNEGISMDFIRGVTPHSLGIRRVNKRSNGLSRYSE